MTQAIIRTELDSLLDRIANPAPTDGGVDADCRRMLPQLAQTINALRAENAKIRQECRNEPCGDALELLWKEIILRRKPAYGEWEYPGMAYRHIKAEFEQVESALRKIATIKDRIPFDAADAATECIQIAKEALR